MLSRLNLVVVVCCYLRAKELGACPAVDRLWGGTGIESRKVDEFLNTRLSCQPSNQSCPIHMDTIEVIVPEGNTVEERQDYFSSVLRKKKKII